MQNYIDSATQKEWGFDDDVIVRQVDGKNQFFCADGETKLEVPETLVLLARTSEAMLERARTEMIGIFVSNQQALLQKPITYLNHSFQADEISRAAVQGRLIGFGEKVPDDFYWLDDSNQPVPMTFTDLQGLATAIENNYWIVFKRFQDAKSAVLAAKKIKAIQSITF